MTGAEQVRSRVTRKMVRELARDQIIYILHDVVKIMDTFSFLSLAGTHWSILSMVPIQSDLYLEVKHVLCGEDGVGR